MSFVDLSDNERDNGTQAPSSQVPNSESHQQAINYTSLAATAAAVAASGVKSNVSEQEQQSLSSTETLLRNIQSLLTVAADNARQQERQISYEKGTMKMCVFLCLAQWVERMETWKNVQFIKLIIRWTIWYGSYSFACLPSFGPEMIIDLY